MRRSTGAASSRARPSSRGVAAPTWADVGSRVRAIEAYLRVT